MRRLFPLSVLVALIALSLSATNSPAVPTPADKPVKWEYGELNQKTTRVGFAKGGDPDAIQPVPPAQAAAIRWTTANEEVTAKNWEELAEKLKAAAPGKEASAASHKLRVFDRLGADGWELVGMQSATTPAASAGSTWIFKRRLP